MLYQGDEDPALYGGAGPSSVDYLGSIYRLRKELPALREGVANYDGVTASGGVFVCLRTTRKQEALVLISFHDQAIQTAVTPTPLPAGSWRDALSGETLTDQGGLRATMAPHQVRVLVRDRERPSSTSGSAGLRGL